MIKALYDVPYLIDDVTGRWKLERMSGDIDWNMSVEVVVNGATTAARMWIHETNIDFYEVHEYECT